MPLLTLCSLDKMLVDNVGDVTITNDGATILSLIEVTHPAVSLTHRRRQARADMSGPDPRLACNAAGQGGRRRNDLGRPSRF